jgi:DNA-binding transcriptional MerR regulator
VILLDIGELSERSGVPASALRYYEEIGLIESLGRRGLRRQFGPEALTQLALISLGKTAGFSLEEIRSAFGKHGATALPRQALHRRADEIDGQIRRLTTLRNALRHVAECPAPSHMECPKFRQLLRLAPHPPPRRKRQRSEPS